MLQPEEIVDLADHLIVEDYQPTLYQVLAAQTVVRQASLQDSGLGSLVRLATVLRPIFSSTPDEQERFEKVYLGWLRARSSRPSTISPSSSRTPPPEPARVHWRMKLAVPCLLVVLALTSWFLWQDLRVREAVGRVVSDGHPIVQARVRLGEQTTRTDDHGMFKVLFKNSDMPLSLLVEMNGYVPSQSQAGQTILENRKWLYLLSLESAVQYQLGDVPLVKETGPNTPPSAPPASVPEPTPPKLNLEKLRTIPPPVPSWWQRLSYSTALMALAPSVLVLLWLLYRFSRRAVLKRQSGRIPPELNHIHVQAGTQRLFPSVSLRYVTQRLRQTRFEESTELDVPRTIHLTMNRGGFFTPAFGMKREPSYVALIDRTTLADHQANMAAQVVRDLAKGYVLLRQYEFDEQPTILRKVDPFHSRPQQSEGATAVAKRLEIMSLGEVTAKFPTSRLLCFAEPMTCFDPLSGKLRPWVETLEVWEERFLFTSETRAQWGQAERILRRRGFHVIPLTHLGLRLFSQLLEQDSSQAESTEETAGKWRGAYERTPQRWLERHPPSSETIAKLMADLRREVGSEGMLWLAACAAYPEIHWALTLEWGVRLFGHGSTAEALLPKLAPLVWFRHAFMPDWFRSALYNQLSAQEAERIGHELGEIISALNPESGDTLQLKIATPAEARQQAAPPVGRFSAWLQRFRRKSAIQAMGRAAEPGNPMRDYVMLQYLSGKQGKALTPYAPKALLTLLFPKGQPWLGFRPLLLIMAAVVITGGLWWWKNPAPIPVPAPITDIGFVPNSTEVILKRQDRRVERWGEKEQQLVLLESGEHSLFATRLATVKMNQLTVSDPTRLFDLTYQKEGELRVTDRKDGQDIVRESAPSSQAASLSWPEGPNAFLVSVAAEVPEVVKISGVENLQPKVIVNTPIQNKQQPIKHPTLLFQVLANQVYKHPGDPMFMFEIDGEMVIVKQKKVPIPLPPAMSRLSLFPEDQWVSLASMDERPLPVMIMRRAHILLAQWLSLESTQPQAMTQSAPSPKAKSIEKFPSKVSGEDRARVALIPVRITYGETRSEAFRELKELLAGARLLESFSSTIDRAVKLPRTLTFATAECMRPNAFYDRISKTITICYELLKHETLSKDGAVLEGAFYFFLYHQLGHALIDLLNLPITGREEDIAVQIAATLLLSGDPATAKIVLRAVPGLLSIDEVAGGEFANEHSLNQQRLYNMICWAIGKDYVQYAYLRAYLKGNQPRRCGDEYSKMTEGVRSLLRGHVDFDELQRVVATERPEPLHQETMQQKVQPVEPQPREKSPSKISSIVVAPVDADGGNPISPQSTEPFGPFQVRLNQVHTHPNSPTLRFSLDGENVLLCKRKFQFLSIYCSFLRFRKINGSRYKASINANYRSGSCAVAVI